MGARVYKGPPSRQGRFKLVSALRDSGRGVDVIFNVHGWFRQAEDCPQAPHLRARAGHGTPDGKRGWG
jgi:hypothetical protein